jgi:serine/threonine-protein kinase
VVSATKLRCNPEIFVESFAPNASLPVLVADLADDGVRDFLQGVALAGQIALVPLLAPPVDRSTHALEVYSPDSIEPLRLLADPVGPPTRDGFPLRLRVREPESATGIRAQRARPATLRARFQTQHELTERHTADLEGGERQRNTTDLVGRAIAGGKLLIESPIGSGGVGAVYKAQHRELRMPVAVKVLHDGYQADADFGRRFHAEALAASRLDHPNVTRVLDFGQEPDGLLYLAMEYLDGVGLRVLHDRERRFGTERVVKLFSQVCAGLAHAHARDIVHKDVKPENLVILQGWDDDGQAMEVVKVCDFGIAQSVASDAPAAATEVRRFQGTPEYMSPEQCLSQELDARTDVYSVGIVMYELVTGDVPFRASPQPSSSDRRSALAVTTEQLRRIVWSHLNERPEAPSKRAPNVDPRLEQIILRALAKEREARFTSMRELRAALRDLLERPPIALSGRHPRAQIPAAGAGARPVDPSTHGRPTENDPKSPGWLIHGGGYGDVFGPEPTAAAPGAELCADPAAFMRRLVSTTDPRAFAELVLPLEAAVRELAAAHHVETLWRLASTLDVLATEGPETPSSRAATSKALLRVLRDPNTLAPIAQRVLATGDATGERLLVAAGSFGAHALYSARVRQADADARTRFIAALRAIGPAALPILRSGLERLGDRLGTPGAIEIAEDLLVSVPPLHDERLGALVAAYARSNVPLLARAAVAALPALWQERCRALVLGLVEHSDEDVAIAAMGGLVELGIYDEHTPRRIASVLDRSSRKAIRLAALRTMAHSKGEARRVAEALLEARLRALRPMTPDEADVALYFARGLLSVASDRAATQRTIDEVSRTWPRELVARLRPDP